MSYDLLLLDKEWFTAPAYPGKYDILSAIINKAYSKPMARFGLFKSTRIKHPDTFLASLQLGDGKGMIYAILLGSKAKFADIEAQHGYVRKFNPEIWPLSTCYDSDLPAHIAEEFGPITIDNVNTHFVGSDEGLDSEILDRIISSVGFKSCDEDYGIKKVSSDFARYEVTAFTAYRRRAGKDFLEFISSELFVTKSLLAVGSAPRFVLHAVVVKDHDLVPYYTEVCGFSVSDIPEVVVSTTGENSPLEDYIIATRDFTLAFLEREVISRPQVMG